MATNNAANNATAASGKVLQGAGLGVASTYSTATYPAIAGTSGNVLTSDGTNWTSAAPSGSSFAPNTTLQMYDDFISTVATSTCTGLLNWTMASSGWTYTSGTASSGHPGVLGNASNGSASNIYLILGGGATFPAQIILGGGVLTINWVFNIVNLSNVTNRYTMFLGMADTLVSSIVNGFGIAYSDNVNSGNWTFKTVSGSTPTTTNSSVAVTTGWHNAQIVVNAAASSIQYNMDGVSLGTAITTNIPTTGLLPIFSFISSAGTIAGGSLLIDLFYLNQTLTNAR